MIGNLLHFPPPPPRARFNIEIRINSTRTGPPLPPLTLSALPLALLVRKIAEAWPLPEPDGQA